MAIKVGDRIPAATLKRLTPEGIKDVNTVEFFKGRKVALFAVPGAFTPTCSAKHLPGFVEKADQIRAKGVSEIVCISVNDAFVMDCWGKDRKVGDKVTLLADGIRRIGNPLAVRCDRRSDGSSRCRNHRLCVEHDRRRRVPPRSRRHSRARVACSSSSRTTARSSTGTCDRSTTCPAR